MSHRMIRIVVPSFATFIACYLLLPVCVEADDWLHWRGSNRNDVISEQSGWRNGKWNIGNILWSKNVGKGSTSPLVIGNRLYTIGWNSGKDSVFCLDAKTGRELWKQSYACPQYGRKSLGDKGIYAGCTSTPEYDSRTGYLYTLSVDGDLHCWNTRKRGLKVWGINLYDKYDTLQRPRVGRSGHRDYGYTSSPLVYNDWLLVEVGSAEGTVMAFDKKTGSRVWASEYNRPAGHTGGMSPITVQGVPCVVLLTHFDLLVVRLDGNNIGKTVARFPWTTTFSNNIASPTVFEDSVVLTSAYNQYAVCRLKITLDGAKPVWKQEFTSKVCSPLVHKGHVYWVWRNLYCLDFESGKLKWKGQGGHDDAGSCIVTADDRLILWTNRGRLLLVELALQSPEKETVLAEKKMGFRTDVWPHIVLSGSRFYCKDRSGNLKCLPLTNSKTTE